MHIPAVITRAVEYFRRQLPTLDPKDLLPLGINVQTGAIILGNPSTPNLLVAEFHSALGTYSTSPVCDSRVKNRMTITQSLSVQI